MRSYPTGLSENNVSIFFKVDCDMKRIITDLEGVLRSPLPLPLTCPPPPSLPLAGPPPPSLPPSLPSEVGRSWHCCKTKSSIFSHHSAEHKIISYNFNERSLNVAIQNSVYYLKRGRGCHFGGKTSIKLWPKVRVNNRTQKEVLFSSVDLFV
jgi:hypothetical protein